MARRSVRHDYLPAYRSPDHAADGSELLTKLALKGLSLAAGAPGGLAALSQYAPSPDRRLRTRLWDLPFVNPLGVAAGLDKNAVAVGRCWRSASDTSRWGNRHPPAAGGQR
ncbi:MAG: hypothetical protein R2849_20005 [Thermomicrobiales bacterium]